MKGTYKVGFSVNRKEYFVMAYKSNEKGNAIGAYGVTFHKRAKYIYKTVTDCKG